VLRQDAQGEKKMLSEIRIENMILIDELQLQFGPGLNVMTGETGAGKSIIADCLELLIGERFNSDMVRDKTKKSVVEGVFTVAGSSPLAEFLQERELIDGDEDHLIISRQINTQGRTINRVNDRTVTASFLKNLAEYLVDIHLQDDHHQILNPRLYTSFLDSLSPEIQSLTSQTAQVYKRWKTVIQEIDDLKSQEGRRSADQEYIEFQIAEIEGAALIPGEFEELEQEKNRILSAEKISLALSQVQQLVFGDNNSAVELLAEGRKALRGVDDPFFEELTEILQEAYFLLEDAGKRMQHFWGQLEYEPNRLEIVDNRLQVINKIKRKYGEQTSEVLEQLNRLREERVKLERLEFQVLDLEKERDQLWQEYDGMAERITELRQMVARSLEIRIKEELAELSMPGVRFVIEVNEGTPSANGHDEVAFLFSANSGEELRPLNRIASGGEISRFILALKAALAEAYHVPVLIFDEIDVGVGGQALLGMGAKLRQLSRTHQVILITHSPQIACLADIHWQLHKESASGHTQIAARLLDEDERIGELARMLAGDQITETARNHVRQMLQAAHQTNQN